MSQERGFKHITVTPAGDEDVVIRAGLVPAEERTGEGSPEPPETRAASVQQRPGGEEGELPAASGAESAAAPKPEPPVEPAPVPAPAAGKRSGKADAYRETTLADLEPAPMPLAQKVVVIAAVICIIGAIVYYFAVLS